MRFISEVSFNREAIGVEKRSLAGVHTLLQEPSVRFILSAGRTASSLLGNTGFKVAATEERKCLHQTGGKRQV